MGYFPLWLACFVVLFEKSFGTEQDDYEVDWIRDDGVHITRNDYDSYIITSEPGDSHLTIQGQSDDNLDVFIQLAYTDTCSPEAKYGWSPSSKEFEMECEGSSLAYRAVVRKSSYYVTDADFESSGIFPYVYFHQGAEYKDEVELQKDGSWVFGMTGYPEKMYIELVARANITVEVVDKELEKGNDGNNQDGTGCEDDYLLIKDEYLCKDQGDTGIRELTYGEKIVISTDYSNSGSFELKITSKEPIPSSVFFPSDSEHKVYTATMWDVHPEGPVGLTPAVFIANKNYPDWEDASSIDIDLRLSVDADVIIVNRNMNGVGSQCDGGYISINDNRYFCESTGEVGVPYRASAGDTISIYSDGEQEFQFHLIVRNTEPSEDELPFSVTVEDAVMGIRFYKDNQCSYWAFSDDYIRFIDTTLTVKVEADLEVESAYMEEDLDYIWVEDSGCDDDDKCDRSNFTPFHKTVVEGDEIKVKADKNTSGFFKMRFRPLVVVSGDINQVFSSCGFTSSNTMTIFHDSYPSDLDITLVVVPTTLAVDVVDKNLKSDSSGCVDYISINGEEFCSDQGSTGVVWINKGDEIVIHTESSEGSFRIVLGDPLPTTTTTSTTTKTAVAELDSDDNSIILIASVASAAFAALIATGAGIFLYRRHHQEDDDMVEETPDDFFDEQPHNAYGGAPMYPTAGPPRTPMTPGGPQWYTNAPPPYSQMPPATSSFQPQLHY